MWLKDHKINMGRNSTVDAEEAAVFASAWVKATDNPITGTETRTEPVFNLALRTTMKLHINILIVPLLR